MRLSVVQGNNYVHMPLVRRSVESSGTAGGGAAAKVCACGDEHAHTLEVAFPGRVVERGVAARPSPSILPVQPPARSCGRAARPRQQSTQLFGLASLRGGARAAEEVQLLEALVHERRGVDIAVNLGSVPVRLH